MKKNDGILRLVKVMATCLFFWYFCGSPQAYVNPDFPIQSEATILYHRNTNTLVYQNNQDKPMAPASLTKIMSAVVVLEQFENLHQTVEITPAMLAGLSAANASVAGFVVGEVLSIEQLLYGLLLPSGGDAANALAMELTGSLDGFVSLMNAAATRIGLEHTKFKNATGLDAEGQTTTASDLLRLFDYALSFDVFRSIITTNEYVILSNKHPAGLKLLSSMLYGKDPKQTYYSPYLAGGKTGYTGKAGRCLISLSQIDGEEYILVSLHAPFEGFTKVSRSFEDAENFYEWAYDRFYMVTYAKKGELFASAKIKNSWTKAMDIAWPNNVTLLLDRYDQSEVALSSTLSTTYDTPIEENQALGTVSLSYQGNLLYEQEIVASRSIKRSLVVAAMTYIVSFVVSGLQIVYRNWPYFGILLLLVSIVFGIRGYHLTKISRQRKQRKSIYRIK